MSNQTAEAWDPNDIGARPAGSWQYYRAGKIVPITEEEARRNFDCWHFLSDDRGAATFMIEQLWNEIDQLRALCRTPVNRAPRKVFTFRNVSDDQ